MPWEDIPLPKLIYKSADPSELPEVVGGDMMDMFITELQTYKRRPTLSEFADLGTNDKVDGLWWWDNNNFPLAVSKGSIFKLAEAGNVTDITGDKLLTRKIATFADDGDTAVIANGTRMVTTDGSTNTAFMADADAPTEVSHVAFLDGHMLANKLNTKRWQFSSNTNILEWAALDFFSAEADPDNLTALKVINREIHLFGPEVIEIWYNDGSSPFSRFETGFIEEGIRAIDSLKKFEGTWIFLNKDIRFVQIEGRNSREISGPFNDVFATLRAPEDARAMIVHIGNQVFYVVNFDADNRTFAYDLKTRQWGEWGNWNSATGLYNKFLGQTHAFAKTWNKHLIGSHNNGKIYELNFTNADDAGSTVRSVLRTGPITRGVNVFKRCKGIRIRMKRGLGTGLGTANEDPHINVRWLDDGGPWSNEIQVSLGKIGDTNYFVEVDDLGMYRSREWEFIHTFDTDFTLVGIEEDVELMRH